MGSSSSSPLTIAEEALLHARAAAETSRAEADVFAAKSRAAADTSRAAAETTQKYAAVVFPLVLGTALGALLAADYYFHESRGRIRREMLHKLRGCRLPPTVSTARPLLLRTPQPPLVLGFRPRMLLGPTGCGKSTLLDCIARDAVEGDASAARPPAPAVLMKLRLPSSDPLIAAGGGAPVSSRVLMDSAAGQFYSQIGYPRRRSYFGAALSRGFTLQGSFSKGELDAAASASSVRLVIALETLFSVCAELQRERMATGMSAHDAAPVLIFDEVQDLIKDERLRDAGGQLVFRMLATLLVAYGVDRKAVRVVVAGSSAELDFAFDATTAKGNRWRYYSLQDPLQADVVSALKGRGYSEDEAAAMVALCGTRLRLLEDPLTDGCAKLDAARFLEETAVMGRQDFHKFFAQLDSSSGGQLARVLDGIAASDAAEARGSGCAAGVDVQRPTKSALPQSMREVDFASILYVDRGRALFFQSPLHAHVWESVRGSVVATSSGGNAAVAPAPPLA